MAAFPIEDYFRRIGYSGSAEPSLAVLRALHRAQVLAIPFENLDPLTGTPASLEPADLADKLLFRGRGGYCFELNGLFLLVLRELGFRTRPLAARVALSEGVYGARAHQITLVETEGAQWLADVGFGGNGLIDPILFEPGAESDQKLDRFHLLPDAEHGWLLQHRFKDGWRTLYAFFLDPYLEADYRLMNYFVSRSPDSLFTRVPLCVRTTENERTILFGDTLKIRGIDSSTVRTLESAEDLRAVLAGHFGIAWDGPLPEPQPIPAGAREI